MAGIHRIVWLDWRDARSLPPWADGIPTPRARVGAIYEGYERDAVWDWELGGFYQRAVPRGHGIGLERRRHGHRTPLYVVTAGDEVVFWSPNRTWALLEAAERRGLPPFSWTADGVLRAEGRSPWHLPLPVARLAVICGIGVPGPKLVAGRSGLQVERYEYPFGNSLKRLMCRLLPQEWIASTKGE